MAAEVRSSKVKSSTAPGTPPPTVRVPAIRCERGPGGKARVWVSAGGPESVEVTGALTGAIAHALWQLRGGADIGNWVDAERLFPSLLAPPPAPASPEVVIAKRRTARR